MFFKNYWKAILWFVIIILLSVLSSNRLPSVNINLWHTDKIAHFIMYLLFSYFIMEGNGQSPWGLKKSAVIIAFIFPFLVGLSIEFVQEILTETRTGELFDFIANTLGVLMGIIFYPKIFKWQVLIIKWLKRIVSSG